MKPPKCSKCGHEFMYGDFCYNIESYSFKYGEKNGINEFNISICEDCYNEKVLPSIIIQTK
jgi:hypothetical protein